MAFNQLQAGMLSSNPYLERERAMQEQMYREQMRQLARASDCQNAVQQMPNHIGLDESADNSVLLLLDPPA